LLAESLDRVQLAEVPLPYERLRSVDEEVLMGVRMRICLLLHFRCHRHRQRENLRGG